MMGKGWGWGWGDGDGDMMIMKRYLLMIVGCDVGYILIYVIMGLRLLKFIDRSLLAL